MQTFKADLHIHTLLSPCGSLEMSPVNIIETALKEEINILAITDHNCTKQAVLIKKMAAQKGIYVLLGAEVNSAEEVHCLTFFDTIDQLNEFQYFIDQHTMPILNKPDIFGEQIVVDENEMIVAEEKYLLINALNASLLEIEHKVHQLGGLVVPAHVDRPYNGLFSQLGFIPDGLIVDAFELSKNASVQQWQSKGKLPENACIIRSSDAHHPNQIGSGITFLEMEKASFSEIRMAFYKQKGRSAKPVMQT